MECYIVVEKYFVNEDREPENVKTYIRSVHSTMDKAVKALNGYRDEIWDTITGEDENNTSNVSIDEPWDGDRAVIGSCNCDSWELTIEVKDID